LTPGVHLNTNDMKSNVILIIAMILFSVGCSKDDSSSDSFSNQLTLGTGLNPANSFELTGEGTLFPAGSQIYFRLESKDDMAGSAVKLRIKEVSSGTTQDLDYPSLQDYGHIYISAFTVSAPGNFTATGILTEGNKTIDSINFRLE
jgi:hypothetical protein